MNKLAAVATPVQPRRMIPLSLSVLLHYPIDFLVSFDTIIQHSLHVLTPLGFEIVLQPRICFWCWQIARVILAELENWARPAGRRLLSAVGEGACGQELDQKRNCKPDTPACELHDCSFRFHR